MLNLEGLRRLQRLDLNLLTVLHVLIETRSTTETAKRLGRTQPAVSHALGRLRALFDDPILIRHGPRLTPSALAIQLAHPLESHLDSAVNLISPDGVFDPAATRRSVVIAGADITLGLQMRMMDTLLTAAPGLRVRLDGVQLSAEEVASGRADLAVWLYPRPHSANVVALPLRPMEWAVYAGRNHPIGDHPSLDEWLAFPHVQVATGPNNRGPIDTALSALQRDRTIRFQVSHFLQALHAVADTDMLFATLAPLADGPAHRLRLRRLKLPLEVAPVPGALVLRDIAYDPFSLWLRETVRQSLPDVLAAEEPDHAGAA